MPTSDLTAGVRAFQGSRSLAAATPIRAARIGKRFLESTESRGHGTRICVLILAASGLAGGQTFSLGSVVAMQSNHLIVNAKGTPDAATVSEYTSKTHYGDWRVLATDGKAKPPGKTAVQVTDVSWFAASHRFELTYDPTPLNGRSPHEFAWSVSYGAGGTTVAVAASKSGFGPAASKDKADVYFCGSYLAGEGTKPIYSIDAELNWFPEIHRGLFLGPQASVLVNSSATPPANRSNVDPDSIAAGLTLRTMLIHDEVALDANVARGEFSRKNAEASFVPSFTLKWIRRPWAVGKRQFAALYPLGGIEGGRNLDKPAQILKQTVNLSQYNGILRGVAGAYAAYYLGKPKPDSASPYLFEIYTSYTARIPGFKEPFVTSAVVNGLSQARINLGTNTRHYVESGVLWNASAYVGVQAKYIYGSLPPLFQFIDNQVTVGLTFKATLPGH